MEFRPCDHAWSQREYERRKGSRRDDGVVEVRLATVKKHRIRNKDGVECHRADFVFAVNRRCRGAKGRSKRRGRPSPFPPRKKGRHKNIGDQQSSPSDFSRS